MLFVAAVFYLAVVRYCCITARSSSFVLGFDSPVQEAQFARRPVADHEPWTSHELLSFMPDDDPVSDASRLQKYRSSPLGPSGSGKNIGHAISSNISPRIGCASGVLKLYRQVNSHIESFVQY